MKTKKLIKTIASLSCGLGLVGAVPAVTTACGGGGNTEKSDKISKIAQWKQVLNPTFGKDTVLPATTLIWGMYYDNDAGEKLVINSVLDLIKSTKNENLFFKNAYKRCSIVDNFEYIWPTDDEGNEKPFTNVDDLLAGIDKIGGSLELDMKNFNIGINSDHSLKFNSFDVADKTTAKEIEIWSSTYKNFSFSNEYSLIKGDYNLYVDSLHIDSSSNYSGVGNHWTLTFTIKDRGGKYFLNEHSIMQHDDYYYESDYSIDEVELKIDTFEENLTFAPLQNIHFISGNNN